MDIHHNTSIGSILEDDSISLESKTRIHYCLGKGAWSWLVVRPFIHSLCITHFTFTSTLCSCFTTTIGGYFAIWISSQTTKKEVSKSPLLRTIIPRKLLSFCDTITFVPVQSQVLRNSGTWYNRKTFQL
jgi:hypothetical protein